MRTICFDDISHVEDQKISKGINNLNYENESSIEMSHYLIENAKYDLTFH